MAANIHHSQPYHLDPPVTDDNISKIVTDADEMFHQLYEDVAAVNDQLAIDEAAIAAAASVAAIALAAAQHTPLGMYGLSGEDGLSIIGPPGIQGIQGIQGVPGMPGEDGDSSWYSLPPTPDPFIAVFGRFVAQTAAVGTVVAHTVGVADGSFLVSANVNVTASATHSFTVTVDYTDETSATRTLTLTFSQLAGTLITAITNVTGTGPYSGVPLHLRCKAATTITIATVGVFTSVTYNVEGSIRQIN